MLTFAVFVCVPPQPSKLDCHCALVGSGLLSQTCRGYKSLHMASAGLKKPSGPELTRATVGGCVLLWHLWIMKSADAEPVDNTAPLHLFSQNKFASKISLCIDIHLFFTFIHALVQRSPNRRPRNSLPTLSAMHRSPAAPPSMQADLMAGALWAVVCIARHRSRMSAQTRSVPATRFACRLGAVTAER